MKTTENKIHFPRWFAAFLSVSVISVSVMANQMNNRNFRTNRIHINLSCDARDCKGGGKADVPELQQQN